MIKIVKKSNNGMNNYPDNVTDHDIDRRFGDNAGTIRFDVDIDEEDSENGVPYNAYCTVELGSHGIHPNTLEILQINPIARDPNFPADPFQQDAGVPEIQNTNQWYLRHKNSIELAANEAEVEPEENRAPELDW